VPEIERQRTPLASAGALLLSPARRRPTVRLRGKRGRDGIHRGHAPPAIGQAATTRPPRAPRIELPADNEDRARSRRRSRHHPAGKAGATAVSTPESQPAKGCPPGLSDQVCRETANAKIGQEDSPHQATEERKCPASLSKAECQALVSSPKTEAPKPESSSPTGCPPALSGRPSASKSKNATPKRRGSSSPAARPRPAASASRSTSRANA